MKVIFDSRSRSFEEFTNSIEYLELEKYAEVIDASMRVEFLELEDVFQVYLDEPDIERIKLKFDNREEMWINRYEAEQAYSDALSILEIFRHLELSFKKYLQCPPVMELKLGKEFYLTIESLEEAQSVYDVLEKALYE